MIPYWLLFLLPAGMAFSPIKGDKNVNSILWVIVGLLCILMIGLRYKVGGDWDNYITYIDLARPRDFSIADTLAASYGNATGYMIISWIAIQLGLGVYTLKHFLRCNFYGGLDEVLPKPAHALGGIGGGCTLYGIWGCNGLYPSVCSNRLFSLGPFFFTRGKRVEIFSFYTSCVHLPCICYPHCAIGGISPKKNS